MEKLKQKHNKLFNEFKKQKDNIRRLWNIDENGAKLLFFLALSKNAQYILEIGTSNGYSTFWLSLAAAETGGRVHSIEVDDKRYLMAKENLSSRNNITLHHAKAEDILSEFPEGIDFLFIDAGKPGYIDYIKQIEPMLAAKAVVIADNITSHPDTTRAFREYMESSDKYFCQVLEIDAGLLLAYYIAKGEK